jgi:hypothetical protein
MDMMRQGCSIMRFQWWHPCRTMPWWPRDICGKSLVQIVLLARVDAGVLGLAVLALPASRGSRFMMRTRHHPCHLDPPTAKR